ncbi:MAG: transporter [Alphaproteobacteria bacterium]|nr:transporter [Alphaproteobacteria bacterium]
MSQAAALATPIAAQPQRVPTLLAAGIGGFMLSIDMFLVTVALPRIGADFAATSELVGWVVSANALTQGVFTIAAGRVGDIVGRKLVFMTGLTLFTLASIACGLSAELWQLILARAVQGLGAAAMWPGTLSLLVQAFPANQRGKAIGISGGIAGIGLLLGPVLGGLLAGADSWRWVFFINAPVGLLAFVFCAWGVRESRDDTVTRQVDWLGVTLVSLSLLLLLVGIRQGSMLGWASLQTWALLLSGAFVGYTFIAWQKRVAVPLIDLSLFFNRTFAIACAVSFLFFAGNFGALPFLSLYMQNFMGFGPLDAGLAFLPSTLPVAITLLIGGSIAQKHAARIGVVFAIAGACVIVAGLWLALVLTPQSSYWGALLPSYVIRGIGIGLMVSATSFAAVSALPPQQSGFASGTLSMARQVGTAFGVALCAAVYVDALSAALPPAAAGNAPTLAAAERFFVRAPEALQPAVAQAIVDGLIWMTVVTTAIFAVAVALTLLMRKKA